MSIAARKRDEANAAPVDAAVTATYTICPVLVASHVAVEKGWLADELRKTGASLRYLRTLPQGDWLAHFTHRLPNFFRDGGNIPAIWTRSEGVDTKLVGLTFSGDGGKIVVRADSRALRTSDLKGKRIGLSRRLREDRVDFWRATAHRGILLALAYAGLGEKDVEIVDLAPEGPDYASDEPADSPAEFWSAQGHNPIHTRAEIDALLSGKVEAIYSNHGRAIALEAEGKVKTLFDLGSVPDWTSQVANSPYTITVSGELARRHPEIVVAYLRAAIKAGKWIEAHPREAADIFTDVTSFACGRCLLEEIRKHDFVPNLSAKNLAAIGIETKFLKERGYIRYGFDVDGWVDASFLEAALRQS